MQRNIGLTGAGFTPHARNACQCVNKVRKRSGTQDVAALDRRRAISHQHVSG